MINRREKDLDRLDPKTEGTFQSENEQDEEHFYTFDWPNILAKINAPSNDNPISYREFMLSHHYASVRDHARVKAVYSKQTSSKTNSTTRSGTKKISKPGDAVEVEAEQITKQVMAKKNNSSSENATSKPINYQYGSYENQTHTSDGFPLIVRAEDITRKPEENSMMQESGGALETTASFEEQLAATESGGAALDAFLLARLEQELGVPLGHVRIHTDSAADALARGVGALAFTHGHHIYFQQGKFNPLSDEGYALLVHELVHAGMQQAQTINRMIYREPAILRQFKDPEPVQAPAELVLFEQKIDEFGKFKLSVEYDQELLKEKSAQDDLALKVKTNKISATAYGPDGVFQKMSYKAAEINVEKYEYEPGIVFELNTSFLNIDVKGQDKLGEPATKTSVDLAAITFVIKGFIDLKNVEITNVGLFIKENLPFVYELIKKGLRVKVSGEVKAAFDLEDLNNLREMRNQLEKAKELEKEAETLKREAELIKRETEMLESQKKQILNQADNLKNDAIAIDRKKRELQKTLAELRKKGSGGALGKRIAKLERHIAKLSDDLLKTNKIAQKLQGKLTTILADLKKQEAKLAQYLLKRTAILERSKVIRESAEKLYGKLSGKLAKLIGKKTLITIGKVLSVVGALIEIIEAVVALIKIALNYDKLGWIWNGGIPLDEIPIERLPDDDENAEQAESMDQVQKGGTVVTDSSQIKESENTKGAQETEEEKQQKNKKQQGDMYKGEGSDLGKGDGKNKSGKDTSGDGTGEDGGKSKLDSSKQATSNDGTADGTMSSKEGKGNTASEKVEEEDEDKYWPLERSQFAEQIFRALERTNGKITIANEEQTDRFVDLVNPYREFLTFEQIAPFLEAAENKVATANFDEFLAQVKERLEALKAKQLAQESTTTSGDGAKDSAASSNEENNGHVAETETIHQAAEQNEQKIGSENVTTSSGEGEKKNNNVVADKELPETAEVLAWKEPSANTTPLMLRYFSSPDINWGGLKKGITVSFTLKIHYIDSNGIKRVASSDKPILFIFDHINKSNQYYFVVAKSFRIETGKSIIYFPENYKIILSR